MICPLSALLPTSLRANSVSRGISRSYGGVRGGPIVDYESRPRRKRGKVWSKNVVPTKRQAQKLADEFMATVNERNNGASARAVEADTFAELVQMYRDKIFQHLKNSTRMNYDFFLNHYLIPQYGTQKLTKIQRLAVQDFINDLELAPKTVRNLHACFRVILNEGIRWGMLKDNPVVGVRLPRIPRKQKQLLQPEQIRQLVGALPWPTQAIVILMVAGSLRFGEWPVSVGNVCWRIAWKSGNAFTRGRSTTQKLTPVIEMCRSTRS